MTHTHTRTLILIIKSSMKDLRAVFDDAPLPNPVGEQKRDKAQTVFVTKRLERKRSNSILFCNFCTLRGLYRASVEGAWPASVCAWRLLSVACVAGG